VFHCNGSGNNYGDYCYVSGAENDACSIAMEAGIIISNYFNVSGDENVACHIAIEAGITKAITG